MKKKYQVFVSSTYKDLADERAAVTQCLLEMGCIPVGMEQFPASDMSQMDYIEMMLDDCDYYVLILAGKYGSCDSDGIGFTEKEYDYAISKGIPVMSYVIRDAGKLINEKCETTGSGRKKLQAFRTKVCSGKLVKFYTDIGSLQAAVAVSLNRCIQDFPAVGWIRGDATDAPDDIETKIEKYMREHTATKEDIEALFKGDTIILSGGNASSHIEESSSDSFRNTISTTTVGSGTVNNMIKSRLYVRFMNCLGIRLKQARIRSIFPTNS